MSPAKSTTPTLIAGLPWVMLFVVGCAMEGVAVHELLRAGTCSTNGYTRYGPAPICPSGGSWAGWLLMAGLPVTIVSGASAASPIRAWHFFPGLFGAVGLGALTTHAAAGSIGNGTAFRMLFGGLFILAGAGLGAVVWYVKGRSRQPVG